MVDYPYFVNLRGEEGLNRNHPATANLRQVTLAWPSPIRLAAREGNRASPLLQSSAAAWLSTDTDVLPRRGNRESYPSAQAAGRSDEELRAPYTLAVVLEGRFDSWFADRPLPTAAPEPGAASGGELLSLIKRSPESARLVVFASNSFLDDRVMSAIAAGSGTGHLQALDLFSNVLDWALQDDQLVGIRARGHFNRTLQPMERRTQANIEYLNYGLALAWLALVALASLLLGRLRRRRYARELGL
jgi:ABC-2 type transport system permease protein